MKKHVRTLGTAVMILTLAAGAVFFLAGPQMASACGWGQSGGGDYYSPQRRDSSGYLAQKQSVTQEQARDIVAYHVQKLNPELDVGNVNDAGGFYEAEILSKDKEVLQLLGVDKYSGRVMLLE